LRAAERIINQDEYHKATEGLRFSVGVKAEGWRRPALLKKLRQAFAAA
jgi:hypothetical protein